MDPSVSPDGRKIVYSAGHYEWNVVEIGLADGAAHTLIENGEANVSPDWSPSGTHFLFSTQGAIMDREASGGEFSRRLIDTSYDSGSARWSPDGARFVFVDNGITNRLLLAAASGGHATLLDQADNIRGVAWSPDAQWISYCRHSQGEWKLAKIRPLSGAGPVILADCAGVRATQWSPAANWILYSTGNSLKLISPDGKSTRTLSSRPFMAYNFSNDGGTVYGIFHNTTGQGPEWQLYQVGVTTGTEKLLSALDLPPAIGSLSGFSIHPDGKRALTTIAKWPFRIWMLQGFQQPRAKNWFAKLVERQ
jgi:dipeptidyl aminopeptidase/acylaminoacyl peptidase